MENQNRVEVIDRDGWQKIYPVERNIFYVGSTPGNDLILNTQRGLGVAPRHLQVISLPGTGYRLINLSDQNIILEESGGKVIAPRASEDVVHGQKLKLGEFSLSFLGGAPSNFNLIDPRRPTGVVGDEKVSDYIGLRVYLPQAELLADKPIDGSVTITNKGSKPGVQFKIEIEGMPEDCYNIGSGPILFPNAEKALPLRLLHPEHSLQMAGEYQLKIHVTAPEDYPRERSTVVANLNVLPYYKHAIHLEQQT